MATIKPNIIINEPIKNKIFGYYTVFNKENHNELLIKSKSFDGRKRGTVAKILRGGTVAMQKNDVRIHLLLTSKVRIKLEFILDMIYGSKRDKQVIFNKKGDIIVNK